MSADRNRREDLTTRSSSVESTFTSTSAFHDPIVVRVAALSDGSWRVAVTGDHSVIEVECIDGRPELPIGGEQR